MRPRIREQAETIGGSPHTKGENDSEIGNQQIRVSGVRWK